LTSGDRWRADGLLIAAAASLMTLGGLGVLVGMHSDGEVETAREQAAAPASLRAQRLAAVTATPIWVPTAPALLAARQPTAAVPTAASLAAPAPQEGSSVLDQAPAPTSTPLNVPPPLVRLVGSDFTFVDPPEPGARAHLTVMIENDESELSRQLVLAIAAQWFDGYHVEGSSVPIEANRQGRDGRRRLLLTGLAPGVTTLELDLLSTAEGLEAPDVRLETAAGVPAGSLPGVVLGSAQPPTVAPRPRPGPVMALRIPRLNLSSAVVPTTWEPPPFIVGQLRESAFVTLGNTVLIGHLSGAAGAIFAHLDQLEPGDEIVAISRGLEYAFTVRETFVGDGDDSSPAVASEGPRLTLMTCAGTWNPLTREYADRLWVVAEPADPLPAVN